MLRGKKDRPRAAVTKTSLVQAPKSKESLQSTALGTKQAGSPGKRWRPNELVLWTCERKAWAATAEMRSGSDYAQVLPVESWALLCDAENLVVARSRTN